MKRNDYSENKETIFYRIGDLVFKIISDLPYALPDGNAKDFRITEAPADFTCIFQKVTSIPECTGSLKLLDNAIIGHELMNEKGEYFRGFLWQGKYYDSVLKLTETGGIIYYLSAEILAERFQNGFNFYNYLGSEYIFSKSNALILHSSHIVLNERAILFSAPSGTGKSTQAALWNNYANATIINGDRTLLRKKDDIWYAYGCPMCGTSGIHLQSSAPIHAIIMLEQGPTNVATRLTPNDAFALLYPQITVPRWNQKLVLNNLDLLDDLITKVPIYKYSCTKEDDAVFVLKSILNF